MSASLILKAPLSNVIASSAVLWVDAQWGSQTSDQYSTCTIASSYLALCRLGRACGVEVVPGQMGRLACLNKGRVCTILADKSQLRAKLSSVL